MAVRASKFGTPAGASKQVRQYFTKSSETDTSNRLRRNSPKLETRLEVFRRIMHDVWGRNGGNPTASRNVNDSCTILYKKPLKCPQSETLSFSTLPTHPVCWKTFETGTKLHRPFSANKDKDDHV